MNNFLGRSRLGYRRESLDIGEQYSDPPPFPMQQHAFRTFQQLPDDGVADVAFEQVSNPTLLLTFKEVIDTERQRQRRSGAGRRSDGPDPDTTQECATHQ